MLLRRIADRAETRARAVDHLVAGVMELVVAVEPAIGRGFAHCPERETSPFRNPRALSVHRLGLIEHAPMFWRARAAVVETGAGASVQAKEIAVGPGVI